MAGVSPESSGSGSSYTAEKGRQTLKSFFNGKTPEDIERYLNRHLGNVDDVKWVLKQAANAGDEITIDNSLGPCIYNIPVGSFTMVINHRVMNLSEEEKQILTDKRQMREMSGCTLSGGKRSKRRRTNKRRTSKRRKMTKKRRR
jgi:hypothetical protein